MNKKTHPTRPKTEFIRLVCRQAGEKVDEKLQWAKASLETATQNITALTSTTRGKALGIAAGLSLAACSKDEPIPDPQPTTKANTITVLQNPPTTVSGKVGDTLPFFHGKYRALKGNVAVNVQETEDPSNAIRILAHPHPDSTNVAFDTAGTAKMEVTATSERQVEDDTTFLAEEFTKEITADLSVEAKKAAIENFLAEATPVFRLDGPTELELPFSLSELISGGELQLSDVEFTPKVYADAVNRNGKTVLRLKGPYRGGDAKMTLPDGTVFLLPNMGLDFSAEKKEETMQFLKEQFEIAVLQNTLGNPTDKMEKWNTNPKVWMTGGTEAQREMLKNKILAEFNPILEEAVDAGFTDKLIQFEFVDTKEEANVPFYLEGGNLVENGVEQPGVLGVAGVVTDIQGYIERGGVALYNTETRSDESLIKTTLHEMLRILGMDGEINGRHIGTVHDVLTSLLAEGNTTLTHLNDLDRFFILAHTHDAITPAALPDEARQQYENFIAEPLYEYLKNNP